MTMIRFYGRAAAALGREVQFALPNRGCTIDQLRQLLADRYPDSRIAILSPRLRACVEDQIVSGDRFIRENDEVEFFPPLSGG
jgi:molybdopterin converting factor small subunit